MARVWLIQGRGAEAAERIALLRSCGHEVEVGRAGAEALVVVREQQPDAVVIDLARAPSCGREMGLALHSDKKDCSRAAAAAARLRGAVGRRRDGRPRWRAGAPRVRPAAGRRPAADRALAALRPLPA
ncbi:MAG: response regulator, partial [Deltaproteobacteria bacterium]|nr:response regulator [Deltaproteobacteria bacterium]